MEGLIDGFTYANNDIPYGSAPRIIESSGTRAWPASGEPLRELRDHIDHGLKCAVLDLKIEKLQKLLAELEQLAQAGTLGQEMLQLRQEKQKELQQAQSELEELERPMREFFGL